MLTNSSGIRCSLQLITYYEEISEITIIPDRTETKMNNIFQIRYSHHIMNFMPSDQSSIKKKGRE